jgi:GT2 family glycosyltransferase
MKDLIIIIPTLFNRQDLLKDCVSHVNECINNTKLNVSLKVVINEKSDEFDNWDANVKKLCSNLPFNIAKAVNVGVLDEDAKYYCFFDEGIRIKDKNWIDILFNLYNVKELNVGSVGVRPHSTRELYCNPIDENMTRGFNIPYKIENLLWSDGILFFSREIYDSVNKIDESYFGDCELQDFCYKIHMKDKLNYRIFLPIEHKQFGFDQKINDKQKNETLISLVNKSRTIFNNKWKLEK